MANELISMMVGSLHASIRKQLETIREEPTVQASPELVKRVKEVLLFFDQLELAQQQMYTDNDTLRRKLNSITGGREIGEVEENIPEQVLGYQRFLEQYQRMEQGGAGPEEIYRIAVKDGFENYIALKFIRQIFSLSLSDALEAAGMLKRKGE